MKNRVIDRRVHLIVCYLKLNGPEQCNLIRRWFYGQLYSVLSFLSQKALAGAGADYFYDTRITLALF
jgi:hypothetical protein